MSESKADHCARLKAMRQAIVERLEPGDRLVRSPHRPDGDEFLGLQEYESQYLFSQRGWFAKFRFTEKRGHETTTNVEMPTVLRCIGVDLGTLKDTAKGATIFRRSKGPTDMNFTQTNKNAGDVVNMTPAWAQGRPPAKVGLYVVQMRSGEVLTARVERRTAIEDDREYVAFVVDDCSCELASDAVDVRYVVAHLGPLPAPPPKSNAHLRPPT